MLDDAAQFKWTQEGKQSPTLSNADWSIEAG